MSAKILELKFAYKVVCAFVDYNFFVLNTSTVSVPVLYMQAPTTVVTVAEEDLVINTSKITLILR